MMTIVYAVIAIAATLTGGIRLLSTGPTNCNVALIMMGLMACCTASILMRIGRIK